MVQNLLVAVDMPIINLLYIVLVPVDSKFMNNVIYFSQFGKSVFVL